jgi:hypothetical protein
MGAWSRTRRVNRLKGLTLGSAIRPEWRPCSPPKVQGRDIRTASHEPAVCPAAAMAAPRCGFRGYSRWPILSRLVSRYFAL